MPVLLRHTRPHRPARQSSGASENDQKAVYFRTKRTANRRQCERRSGEWWMDLKRQNEGIDADEKQTCAKEANRSLKT